MSHAGSFIEVRVGSCCSYCGKLAHEVTLRALLCILGSWSHTLTSVGTVLSQGCVKAWIDSAAFGLTFLEMAGDYKRFLFISPLPMQCLLLLFLLYQKYWYVLRTLRVIVWYLSSLSSRVFGLNYLLNFWFSAGLITLHATLIFSQCLSACSCVQTKGWGWSSLSFRRLLNHFSKLLRFYLSFGFYSCVLLVVICWAGFTPMAQMSSFKPFLLFYFLLINIRVNEQEWQIRLQ